MRRRGEGGRGDRGVNGGDAKDVSGPIGFSSIVFFSGARSEGGGVARSVVSSGDLGSLLEGEDCPSSNSSSSPIIGLSSIISVNRLLFLLELMVEVDVEFVSRAMLSSVISLGVEVSKRKSLSRKKFKIVCRWTCARAKSEQGFSEGRSTFNDSGAIRICVLKNNSSSSKAKETE